MYTELTTLADHYHIDLSKPVKELTKEELNLILYGSTEPLTFNYKAKKMEILERQQITMKE